MGTSNQENIAISIQTTADVGGIEDARNSLEKIQPSVDRWRAAMEKTNGDYVEAAKLIREVAQQETTLAAATERATTAVTRESTALASTNVQLARVETATTEASLAQNNAAAGASTYGLQLNRLNAEIGTFLGRITGSNTAVTRMTAVIGGAVTGYGAMIAILAGVGIAIEVIEKLAGYNAKAAEEQDRLTKSLEDWHNVERQGAAGQRVLQIEAEVASLEKLNAQYLKLKNNAPAPTIGGEGGATIDIGALFAPNVEKAVRAKGDALYAAQRDVTLKLEQEQAAALATLITSNKATASERARASQELILMQQRLRDNLNVQGDKSATLEQRAAIVSMVDALNSALNPTKALKDAQRELAAEQKSVADAMDRITNSLKTTTPEWTLNRANYERTTAALKELNAVQGQVGEIAAHNAKEIAVAADAAARAEEASVKRRIAAVGAVIAATEYSLEAAIAAHESGAKILTKLALTPIIAELEAMARLLAVKAAAAFVSGNFAGGAGYTAASLAASAAAGVVGGLSSSGGSGAGGEGGGAGYSGSALAPTAEAQGATNITIQFVKPTTGEVINEISYYLQRNATLDKPIYVPATAGGLS